MLAIHAEDYCVLNNFLTMKFTPHSLLSLCLFLFHTHTLCFLWCFSINADQTEGRLLNIRTLGPNRPLHTHSPEWMHYRASYFNEPFSTITFHLLSISHSIKSSYEPLSSSAVLRFCFWKLDTQLAKKKRNVIYSLSPRHRYQSSYLAVRTQQLIVPAEGTVGL